MSYTRITQLVLASGQPGAYQDTRLVARVIFERTPSMWSPYSILEVKPGDISWEPDYLPLEYANKRLRDMGFIKVPEMDERKHGLDAYLHYLKPIDPEPAKLKLPWYKDSMARVSHIWEYYIITPYTD